MSDARSESAASDVVESVGFGFYTADEVRRISVKAITKPELLDAKDAPVPDGLYDPALGPLTDNDSCKSCILLSLRCPGHCGHIDLAKPLYNPLLFHKLKSLLQISCFHCHRFRKDEKQVQRLVSQLELIIRGDIIAARNISDVSSNEIFLPQDHVTRNGDNSRESYSILENLKKQSWTSLQYTEVKNLLSDFIHKPPKKCENCGKKSPRITSPTYGWLNKVLKASDIRANVIQGLNKSSINEDQSDTHIDSEVENDEVLQSGENTQQTGEGFSPTTKASEKVINISKDLPYEFVKQMHSSGQRHLLPSEVEHIFKGLWKNELRLCTIICDIRNRLLSEVGKSNGYEMFFLKALLVPPSKFRPPAKSSGRGVLEHPQNVILSKVLESNISLRNLIATDPDHPDIVRKWMDLQTTVNILYDSSKGIGKADKDTSGLRQLLEKKAGILRQKMMGKRVNFACRSVISPDPYLAVNEIGIPPYFALRLTYPERVTPWNVNTLRHAIENGADLHPGATHYKDKDIMYKLQSGRHMRNAISRKLPTSREFLTQPGKGPESDFEGKIVYRHLRDGDVVLVNRQPTLHKPSLMAHVVRVLKGEKTIRMHYANCSTYNADFDGDEMNVHLPQDEISRAEALNIVNANMQYIVPTSGKPIRGLIQDHIISAVLLTKMDTFLSRDEYHQLLCAACVPAAAQFGSFSRKVSMSSSNDEIHPLPPAILKPKPLWTGKQVISAILCYITRGRKPFTVEKTGRINKEYFTKNCSEQKMFIYKNTLVHGMIDKEQFEKYGLVHTVHELYGADTAGNLLSIFSRLFTSYLQVYGFTCGVDDLLLEHHSELERKGMLGTIELESELVHRRFTSTESSDIDQMGLQREIEKVIRSNGDSATTNLDRRMLNAIYKLTSEINNNLFPNGLLKPFPKNCLSLMTATGAKGGSVNMSQISSLLGQQELEGKRVPRMISGKTLPCFPPWDISSRSGGFIGDRFLSGLRPQEYYFHCMAGRDGLVDTAVKTSRSGYLQRCIIKNLECLKVCYDHTVRDADGSVIQFTYGEDGVDVLKSSFLARLDVLAANSKVVLEKMNSQLENARLSKSNDFIVKLPPILRKAAISLAERERKKITTHLSKKQRGSGYKIKQKDAIKLMELKYLSSLADPGEPVGVIAGQSIGEPSTQMTLNTFHLAGRGERNVTLGIPRLQEILMTAKENIQTPIMKCPLLDGSAKADADNLAAKFRRISVADIVKSIAVSTVPFTIHKNKVCTVYKLTMKLYPHDLYPSHFGIPLEARNNILEETFVAAMEDSITKHMETISKINDINVISHKEDNSIDEGNDEDVAKSKSVAADDNGDGEGAGDDEGDGNEDQGADAEKRKRQISDEMEYEDGNEKETSTLADEYDEENLFAEFENEDEQLEDDQDVPKGGEFPDTDSDVERPTHPSKVKPVAVPTASKKDMKSGGRVTAMPKRSRNKAKRLISKKLEGSTFEAEFIFRKEPHILLAEIALKTAKNVYLKEYKNIEQCSVVEKKEDEHFELQTSGVNFNAFWDLEDYLTINKLESNDIHAMLNIYGVEAARATIIKEVFNVFDTYGIKVDMRHLSLVADFMTFNGGYRPLNRLGMGNFGTSPFNKMTFETATNFIFEAASHGEIDTLESPSASVCLGQPVKMGTGCFDLMQNLVM